MASDLSFSLPYTHNHPFLTHFLIYASGVKSLRLYIYNHVYIPRTCLSSILVVEPFKRRPFPNKTRVIWVPGIYIYIL